MNASLTSVQTAEPVARLNLLRLLLIGAVLPAAIAAVNYSLMWRTAADGGMWLELGFQFFWYVFQVGLVGYAVGRGISQPVVRWLVFGWIMLLVNLLTWLQALDGHYGWQPEIRRPATAALYGGQIGLCIVWAFFGNTRSLIRWPGMTFVVALFFAVWIGFDVRRIDRVWTEMLFLQVGTLSVLCGLMRFLGFRLLVVEANGLPAAATVEEHRPLQFGLKHVLIWTTVLAVLLGIARALDLLNSRVARELLIGGIGWKLIVATASAIVIIVALWVALGQGRLSTRFAVGLLFPLLVGGSLALWSRARFAALDMMMNLSPLTGVWPQSYYDLLRWYRVGWWWLGWMYLSGGLLAATLIILRTQGYRLVWMRRDRQLPEGVSP